MLLNVFKVDTDDEALNNAVRGALLDALFSSKLSLVIGAALGTATAGVVAYACPSPWLIGCAVLLTLAGLCRVISFEVFRPGSTHSGGTKWEIIYHTGAWAYAAMLGQLTFLTLLLSDDVSLHLLVAPLSTGYAAGAAARNTGRPVVAMGQLMLCTLPLSIALLMDPTVPHCMLALSNILYILVMTDITLQTYKTVREAFIDRQEKLRLATVYEKLSRTDPLTGIDNRMTLKSNLETLLAERRSAVAVLWLDLDRFKQINDTLGHAAGDILLHAVAARLTRLAAPTGMLARFGGDEFILVMPVADVEAALELAETVRATLGEPGDGDAGMIDISASIGLSVAMPGQFQADDVLRHADVALYEAKARGRNCAVLFDPEMEERLLKNKQIENDLKRAIPNNEFELYFQPIIDLGTGQVKSFEALLRWHHPVEGNIPPSVFIPIAEATNHIGPITEWVLASACATAVYWPDDIAVSVNISPALLKTRELPPMIYETLLKSGLQPRRLELEITETALVEDNPNIRVVLDGFSKIGIRLSLDDFGTGFSSLSYLCRYRFDTIKIDRSFTAEVYRSSEACAVVQAIAGLAASLQLTVVAEGIETVDQLDYIRAQGCAAGQGYYFAKPMPVGQINGFLAKARPEPQIPLPAAQQLSLAINAERARAPKQTGRKRA